jgi:hypothetical protein
MAIKNNIINLKEVVLDHRPMLTDEYSRRLRFHALIVYNYIERVENNVIEIKREMANNIPIGDFAVLKGELDASF